MIRNYIKTAFRNLWRHKAFSVINITGLSVALGSCMLILLYTMDEVSYDRFNLNKDKIYRLVSTSTGPTGEVSKTASTGMMPGPAFKQQIPEIENFVRLQENSFIVKRGNDVFNQDALYADESFFSIFSFPTLRGDPKTALKDIHSVVLSEEVAEKYFGKQDAVGRVLDLKVNDAFQPFTVSAVVKQSPQNSSVKIKMLVPMKFAQSQFNDTQWFNFFLNTFFTVKPGSNLKAVEAKINSVFNRDAAAQQKEMAQKYGFKDKVKFSLQPLLQMHTSTDYPSDNGLKDASNPVYSYILTGIAVFILLIACINFINLTVARSLKRAKEIGIRKVVGGMRGQLVMQFLGESFILSFIAFLLAILLVQLALPVFNDLANKALAFSYLLSPKLVIGYIAIFLLTGLLAGFYPALVLSGFNPVQTLYNRQYFAGKNYLSKGLVVLQFTLATFFIISTITIYSQFNYLMHFDLGYDAKNVVSVNAAGAADEQKLELFKTELLKNTGIKSVTADQGGRWGTIAHINNGQQTNFDIKHIDEEYLSLFKIPIVKGRNFSKDMVSDSSNSVLVNETFAKQAGWRNPIGQVVDFFYSNKKYNVIGVVKDYHFASLSEKIGPELFSMNPKYPYGNIYIKISAKNSAEALNYIEKEFRQIFPFKPYQHTFIEAQNAENYDKEAKWKQIVTFSALLTIFISCIGLFGLAALSAERRKKEIGIRKVLGASVEGIVRKLSTDFLKLVIISSVVAIPAAWWAMHKWLENYPYRIKINSWIFLLAAALVMLIALVTVSFQSIRAALRNPVNSLRSE
ncbi:ABC transporter permease [Mucilaginibacter sp. L3T2-6]|uniref:ABC transporter permease n=1 Tax=Mucilaginibacter sp. L3T2-6 TaxID=3062491 RepID=UPI002676C7AE|nr:ABC transporter permease [Mucilaginibacter sp. L3T2-6]MDO3643988.1 ABC transporter permease [Mucilaginibacter sp. L3T2-6]MDV6216439.1 ABC transporter permease [Mucilaginibacter sp. L3T2-6]